MPKGERGFVKVYRDITEWEWYDDANTFRVFMHILLNANWKETKYHGTVISAGELRTTLPEIAQKLKLSERNVRTALEHLKVTGTLTVKTEPKFRIISIKNWVEYQATDRQTDRQLTGNRQATDRQLTGTVSLYRQERKESKESKHLRQTDGQAVPSEAEIKAYFLEKNFSIDPDKFIAYYSALDWKSQGKPIRDWKALADSWQENERDKPPHRYEPQEGKELDKYTSFFVDDAESFGIFQDAIQ